jgi:CDP-glucose 4,6-dehydratase
MPSNSTSWNDANVLVTGGAGFLGTHLVNALLDQGARVTILDIKPSLPDIEGHYQDAKRAAYVSADVADDRIVGDLIQREHFDAVFHLAAEAIVQRFREDTARGLETNVKGTWVLLDAIRRHSPEARIVIASSDKAYGTHEKLPYDETAPLQGRNPYDCSKSCADLIGHMYAHTYGLRLLITRCGNIYGEGDLNFSRLIPDVIRCACRNTPFIMRSNGTFKRDYVYVSDIVAAYIRCAEALRSGHVGGEAYNFGHNKPMAAIDVVKMISRLMNSHVSVTIRDNATYEIRNQYLDATKANERLAWRPAVSMEEGLQRTIAWYSMLLERYPEYAAS